MKTLPMYAKAILACGITFVGAVATGYSDGVMEVGEWWLAASFGLGSLGAVWGVPNTPAPVARGSSRRPHHG